jgi:hypothetical protein
MHLGCPACAGCCCTAPPPPPQDEALKAPAYVQVPEFFQPVLSTQPAAAGARAALVPGPLAVGTTASREAARQQRRAALTAQVQSVAANVLGTRVSA